MAEGMRQINPPCKEEIDMRMLPPDLDDVESTTLSLESGILSEIELQNVSKFANKQIVQVREDLTWRLINYLTTFNFFGTGKNNSNNMMYFVMFMIMVFILLIAHYFFNLNLSSMIWKSTTANADPLKFG